MFEVGSAVVDKAGLSTIKKILVMQVVVIFLVTAGFFLMKEEKYAFFAVVGGLVAFLPNLYFSYRISLTNGESAEKIVRSFYSGESRKILLTCALFGAVFQLPDVQVFPLMTCFVAVLSVFWLALILFAQDFEFKSVRKDGK